MPTKDAGSFSYQWKRRREGRGEASRYSFGLPVNDIAARLAGWIEAARGRAGERLVCIDMGCGSAEKTVRLSGLRPDWRVFGADITDGFHASATKASSVRFFRSDALRPALRPGPVDALVSIGVLHHTPDTREGLRQCLNLLPADGVAVIWLYPGESDPAWRIYYRRRALFQRLHAPRWPHFWLDAVCRAYTLAFALPGWFLRRAWRKALGTWSPDYYETMSNRDRYRSMAFILFDNVSPLYQHHHEAAEVESWASEEGFERVAPLDLAGLYVLRRKRGA